MRSHLFLALGVSSLPLLLATACSDAAFKSSEDAADTGAWYGTGGESPSAPNDADTSAPPPETESNFLAMSPAQTDIFVFIANPDRDTITRVNVYTLAVDTVAVGRNPSIVLTTPDYATAAVFNEDDDTVTLLDANSLEQEVVDVRPNMNRMVMSGDGGWLALWRDEAAVEEDDVTEGLVSYNELDLINVNTAEAWTLAVGAYPHGVEFTPDSSLAVVVSDENLALVDLTVTPLERDLITIAEDLLDPPKAEEVVLAPDGSYAFVRQFGVEEIAIVDLGSQTVDRVAAGSNPTDLDLTPDGQRAVVVARDSNELWVFDVADPFAAPEVLALPDTLTNGSVLLDPTGKKGILYSTAVVQDIYATWDIATGVVTARNLVKPIETISITPTGESVLIFHTLENGPTLSPDDELWDAPALTMIDLDDFGDSPVGMPGPLAGYANANNGLHGYFIMEDQPMLGVLDYGSLIADTVFLSSNPAYVGVLPDLDLEDGDEPPAWASQEHDLGRITFFDPDDYSSETITGFELNSQID